MAFRQNLLINLRRSYLNSPSPYLIRLSTVYKSRFSITNTEEPDFTGVRLQRTITEDGGSVYHDYTIELLRINGVALPLNFRWRQSFGFNPFKNRIAEADRLVAEANELIDWIQKYLEHS